MQRGLSRSDADRISELRPRIVAERDADDANLSQCRLSRTDADQISEIRTRIIADQQFSADSGGHRRIDSHRRARIMADQQSDSDTRLAAHISTDCGGLLIGALRRMPLAHTRASAHRGRAADDSGRWTAARPVMRPRRAHFPFLKTNHLNFICQSTLPAPNARLGARTDFVIERRSLISRAHQAV